MLKTIVIVFTTVAFNSFAMPSNNSIEQAELDRYIEEQTELMIQEAHEDLQKMKEESLNVTQQEILLQLKSDMKEQQQSMLLEISQ